eukprot:7292008-Pyramimonas_sp.AAC.2
MSRGILGDILGDSDNSDNSDFDTPRETDRRDRFDDQGNVHECGWQNRSLAWLSRSRSNLGFFRFFDHPKRGELAEVRGNYGIRQLLITRCLDASVVTGAPAAYL